MTIEQFERLATDAARYQFLRMQRRRSEHEQTKFGWLHVSQLFLGVGHVLTGEGLDKVVDEARAEWVINELKK